MSRSRLPSAAEAIRLPRPPAPPASPGSFVLCPAPVAALSAAQQALYCWALEQAREVARPSLPERDLAGVWN